MAWYVNPTLNNGYPTNTGFPASYPADWSGNYPVSAWRVTPNVNDGYPYTWWHIAIDTGKYYDPSIPIGGDLTPPAPTGDEMEIGGSQTNYPNGFTNGNRGGIISQFDNTNMADTKGGGYGGWRDLVKNVMAGKIYLLNGSELSTMLTNINDTDNIFDQATRQIIQELYGANIYDGILSCKYFPFDVSFYFWTGGETPASRTVKLYGKYEVSTGYPLTDGSVAVLKLGTLDVDIKQAWEIESIDYSIYLPYAGVFPIDIRGACTIQVDLAIDLLEGTGEYTVYIDNIIAGKYRCILACDIPLNFAQGQMQSNLFSNIASIAGQGLKLAGGAVGAAVGGIPGAIVGSSIGGIGTMGSQVLSQHYAVTAQAIGGSLNFGGYPYCRLLAKVPKMHKDGYGYAEILGENRSTTYTNLNSVSGFVQTKNYKSDIIVATDAEKAEIERLLNSGVFL